MTKTAALTTQVRSHLGPRSLHKCCRRQPHNEKAARPRSRQIGLLWLWLNLQLNELTSFQDVNPARCFLKDLAGVETMHGVCAYGSLTEIMPKHIAIPVSILSKLLLNSKILFARLAIHHVQWVQRPGLISHML